jgi:DNA-binding CsgD family transcriptional regulator
VTGFLAGFEPGTADDPVPRPSLVAVRDLIGADQAEYFEFRRSDRALVAHAQSHAWDEAPGTDEAILALGYQNPLRWQRWHPADGPLRLSTQISRRALQRLAFHDAVMRPNGLTDILKVWLHSDAGSVACLQLWMRGSTFGQRQEDILGVLQHHLVHLRTVAMQAAAGTEAGAWLSRREVEVLTWAVRGEKDQAIGERLGISAATVGKHLEHAFATLGVHSRVEALWRMTARQAATPDMGGEDREA